MRIILIIPIILLLLSKEVCAQNDFRTLDRKTYDYFIRGDYKNLKRTADTLHLLGIDYYYLRERLGLTGYIKQDYPNAVRDLSRAIEFNSIDTISREYIYNSYIFSGRKADAILYLNSIPEGERNASLRAQDLTSSSEFFLGSSGTAYDVINYQSNSLDYEAVKSSLSVYAGVESYFLKRYKGTLSYTNFQKSGTQYSPLNTSGKDLNFMQNQFYGKISACFFPGWEVSGFSNVVFYNESVTKGFLGNRFTVNQITTEYLLGIGGSKNLWKIRAGANVSFSNFGNSTQIRGEGYFIWLPAGNLNLYLTSGWLGQSDNNWGGTYQVSEEIGLKIFKSLWLESGLVKGNSFLYASYFGSMINNSFQIPATTIYSNLIFLAGRHIKLTITPFYSENNIYSWDLIAYSRTNKLTINSFGGLVKLTYKFR
jgi:hypothetical protein